MDNLIDSRFEPVCDVDAEKAVLMGLGICEVSITRLNP